MRRGERLLASLDEGAQHVKREAPGREVALGDPDEFEQRQALRFELQEAFDFCTSTAARRWLREVTGRAALPMVASLDDAEVRKARMLLAARKAGG